MPWLLWILWGALVAQVAVRLKPAATAGVRPTFVGLAISEGPQRWAFRAGSRGLQPDGVPPSPVVWVALVAQVAVRLKPAATVG